MLSPDTDHGNRSINNDNILRAYPCDRNGVIPASILSPDTHGSRESLYQQQPSPGKPQWTESAPLVFCHPTRIRGLALKRRAPRKEESEDPSRVLLWQTSLCVTTKCQHGVNPCLTALTARPPSIHWQTGVTDSLRSAYTLINDQCFTAGLIIDMDSQTMASVVRLQSLTNWRKR